MYLYCKPIYFILVGCLHVCHSIFYLFVGHCFCGCLSLPVSLCRWVRPSIHSSITSLPTHTWLHPCHPSLTSIDQLTHAPIHPHIPHPSTHPQSHPPICPPIVMYQTPQIQLSCHWCPVVPIQIQHILVVGKALRSILCSSYLIVL